MNFFPVLPLAVFGADSLIKDQVEEMDAGQLPKKLWGDKLYLKRAHNKGISLGHFSDKQELVAGASLGMTLSLIGAFLFMLEEKGRKLLKTGLGLIVGGAASNTWDRLSRKYVVDYLNINCRWTKIRRLIFNLSDICIGIGTFLLFLEKMRRKS